MILRCHSRTSSHLGGSSRCAQHMFHRGMHGFVNPDDPRHTAANKLWGHAFQWSKRPRNPVAKLLHTAWGRWPQLMPAPTIPATDGPGRCVLP